MTATKHTPGPWVVDTIAGSDKPYIFSSGAYRTVAKIIMNASPGSEWKEERNANAALIAAAPDLLAALARATEFLAANYSDADMPDILPACSAALAKAGVP